MACSIAYFGKIMGYDATVVANSKLTSDKRNFIQYFGANLLQVGDFTIEGNRYCQELVQREEPNNYCFLDQLHNWDNPRAHYETTGPEILNDFSEVSLVVGSLGSGGTLLGTAQYVKEKKPGAKVVAVQSTSGTKLPGTGSFDDGDYVTPFIKKGFDEGIFDSTIKINEHDAVRRAIQLREQGIFGGLQTGGVVHAALTAIEQFDVSGDVVVISGDTGWKNMEKLLSVSAQDVAL
jgi:cysteine synthase